MIYFNHINKYFHNIFFNLYIWINRTLQCRYEKTHPNIVCWPKWLPIIIRIRITSQLHHSHRHKLKMFWLVVKLKIISFNESIMKVMNLQIVDIKPVIKEPTSCKMVNLGLFCCIMYLLVKKWKIIFLLQWLKDHQRQPILKVSRKVIAMVILNLFILFLWLSTQTQLHILSFYRAWQHNWAIHLLYPKK
jgi:hypothetical protein